MYTICYTVVSNTCFCFNNSDQLTSTLTNSLFLIRMCVYCLLFSADQWFIVCYVIRADTSVTLIGVWLLLTAISVQISYYNFLSSTAVVTQAVSALFCLPVHIVLLLAISKNC